MEERVQKLFSFIQETPTAFHAVKNIESELKSCGFEMLDEKEEWLLKPGKKYYVKRNQSALAAFVIPKKKHDGYHIIAGHTDSPAFKIKPNPEIKAEDAYLKLNVEKYGGMILSTWLDRPLSIAGRVFLEQSGKIEERLVNFDKDMLVIPNLAIHMNRDCNNGFSYKVQKDMLPVLSENTQTTLKGLLAEELSVKEEDVLSFELYLYVRQKGSFIGADKEWIIAPRLDDLQCVFASLEAIKEAVPKEKISMSLFFDNEEVGSGTKQGADSDFFRMVLERIESCLSGDGRAFGKQMANSMLLSADNAHGLHPNYPEKADLTNRPKLNHGIVLKHHGGQKYTTDGYSEAYFAKLCKEAGIGYQQYCNHSDIAGGSTLGNILTAQVSLRAADIGFAQLAMHSAVETAGRYDLEQGIRLFLHFFGK